MTKFVYALAELVRDLKELVVWMKSNEYPTCSNCRYWCEEDGSGTPSCMFNRINVWHADEYCSKWEEEVK